MVPKVAGKGASFKGAALYYLHDKEALTADRVVFTHTENLPTNDPDLAIRVMIDTAQRADELKRKAGVSTRGRKQENPVYTYSLSWAPDEKPDNTHMVAAAKETLKALGLSGHQALFVAHDDRPHPHIHVIVNRVNPETGVMAKLSKDHIVLSKWAQAYEKQHGKIRCERRADHNERRAQGEFVKDKRKKPRSEIADLQAWRAARVRRAYADSSRDRDALDAAHRAQRQSLLAAKEQSIRVARREIEEAFDWPSTYAFQAQQRDKLYFKHLSLHRQLKAFLKDPARLRSDRETRAGFLSPSFIIAARGEWDNLKTRQKKERARYSAQLKSRRQDAFRQINTQYRAALAALRERQRTERRDLNLRQSIQSQAAARDIKTGADRVPFLKDQVRDALGRAAARPARPDFQRAAGSSMGDYLYRRFLHQMHSTLNAKPKQDSKTKAPDTQAADRAADPPGKTPAPQDPAKTILDDFQKAAGRDTAGKRSDSDRVSPGRADTPAKTPAPEQAQEAKAPEAKKTADKFRDASALIARKEASLLKKIERAFNERAKGKDKNGGKGIGKSRNKPFERD